MVPSARTVGEERPWSVHDRWEGPGPGSRRWREATPGVCRAGQGVPHWRSAHLPCRGARCALSPRVILPHAGQCPYGHQVQIGWPSEDRSWLKMACV